MGSRWTRAAYDAAIAAVAAMLAGEEGEGDGADVAHRHLERALACLRDRAAWCVRMPTMQVLRGLELSLRLSHADLACAEPGDFSAAELEDHAAAVAWVRAQGG